MNIWPWRTRPVVTPFNDDYSGKLIIMGANIPAVPFEWSVPDNLYLVPLSITLHFTTLGGIRSPEGTSIRFSRSGLFFANSVGHPLINNAAMIQSFCPGVQRMVMAGFFDQSHAPIPYPLYCYPSDVITIYVPTFLGTDLFDYAVIHAKTWEIH